LWVQSRRARKVYDSEPFPQTDHLKVPKKHLISSSKLVYPLYSASALYAVHRSTNVFGALNVTRAFLPYMREKGSGTVIFMGSLGGWK